LVRIALFSDIHGNPIALDAVLRDIEDQGGVDEYWVLGDIVAIGHDPAAVVERLMVLPRIRGLAGNTERYVLTGRLPVGRSVVASDPSRLHDFAVAARSFAWTEGHLAGRGLLGWVAALPTELRAVLPDGTRLLAVHATPRRDDGEGLRARHSDAELSKELDGCGADLVTAGHTHRPFTRTISGIQVVNLGSVSNPVTDDTRASYFILGAEPSGYELIHRWVELPIQEIVAAIDQSHFPGRVWLRGHWEGKVADRFA
jgi:predicted phosphodiesterase